MPDSVYKIIDLVGTSPKSWDDAAQMAAEKETPILLEFGTEW